MRIALAALAIVLVLAAAASAAAVQQGIVAQRIRAAIVAELQRATGRAVSIGAVRGDPWGGLVLEDVRIAAGPTFAAGTFARAAVVTVHVNGWRLAGDLLAGRGVVASITGIVLDRPSVEIVRDARGRWNIDDLLRTGAAQPQAAGAAPEFRAPIEFRGGRATLRDEHGLAVRRPFRTAFDRLDGVVEFARLPAIALRVAGRDLTGAPPAPLRAAGTYYLSTGHLVLDLRAEALDVGRWGPYLLVIPRFTWQGGRADADVRLLATPEPGGLALDYRGTLVARGIGGLLDRRHRVTGVDGRIAVDTAHLASERVTGAVDGSSLAVRGEIGLAGGGRVDLVVESAGLDLATLRAVLAPAAALRMTGTAAGEVRVVGAVSAPAVAGRIARARGRLQGEAFADAASGIRYAGGLLAFPDLAASVGGGRVAGAVRIGFGEVPSYVFALTVRDVDLALAGRFGLAPLALTGSASGFLAGVDLGGDPRVLGSLATGRLRLADVALDRASALFWYHGGRLDLDGLLARRRDAVVHASGRATGAGAVDLSLAGVRVDLADASRLLRIDAGVRGTAEFAGRLSGTITRPTFAGQAYARNGALGPVPFERLGGDLTATDRSAATRRTVVEDRGATYVAAGAVQWGARDAIALDLSVQRARAERLASALGLPIRLRGGLDAQVRLGGRLSDPQASGTVNLRDASVEGQRVDRAYAAFRWTGGTLHLDDAAAIVNASTVRASGSITGAGRLDLAFAARDLRLEDVAWLQTPFLSTFGLASLDGTVRGTLAAPEVRGVVESTTLALNGQPFTSARGEVALRDGTLQVSPLDLQQNGSRYRLSGTLTFGRDPSADLRAEVSAGRIATLLGLAGIVPAVAVDGTIDGAVSLTGPLRDPRATLALSLRDGVVGGVTIREGTAAMQLRSGAVTIERFELRPERGRLAAAGSVSLAGQSNVEVAGEDLDLALLRPFLDVSPGITGRANFTLQYRGAPADPTIGLSLELTDAGVVGNTFDRLVATAFYARQTINVQQALLTRDRHRVRGEGTVPFDLAGLRFDERRPVSLRLSLADADLTLLRLLGPWVEQASGALEGRLEIGGTVAQPEMSGFLRTENGTLRLAGLRTPIEGLAVGLTFRGNRLTVDRFTGRLGDGTFAITGGAVISGFLPESVDLRLTGQRLRIAAPPFYTGLADATLRLAGPARSPTLGGDLRLYNGTLTAASVGGDGAAAEREEPPAIAFDLGVRADDLEVVLGPLRTRADGQVRLTGTAARPAASGRVVARGGSARVLNTTFTILEGTATFAEGRGLVPTVFARAQTIVGQTTVVATIQGPADRPDLLLASDPPLPREQILALLGRQAGLGNLAAGDVESLLRQQLTSFLFRSFEEVVARAFGLNEFRLEYDAAQPLRLRIGTFLVRNLYLTLRVIFSEPVRYLWSLEYRFTRTQLVAFEIDSLGNYGISYALRYRF